MERIPAFAIVALIVLAGATSAQAADAPDVAVDAAGNARFAWRDVAASTTRVAERGLTGATLGTTQFVSAPTSTQELPDVAVAPDGTSVFGWQTVEKARGRKLLPNGTLDPIVELFSPVQAFFAGGSTQVAVDASGNAVFAWLQFAAGGESRVQTRTLKANGTQTAVQDLSAAGQGAHDQRLALAPNGDATFLWDRSNGTNTIVQTR